MLICFHSSLTYKIKSICSRVSEQLYSNPPTSPGANPPPSIDPSRPFSFLGFLNDEPVGYATSAPATPQHNFSQLQNFGNPTFPQPSNVPNTAFPLSHGYSTTNRSMASIHTGSTGPKPAMPSPREPYNVGMTWGNVKKCYGCKREFLPASPPDDQFVLVRPEADWYMDNISLRQA